MSRRDDTVPMRHMLDHAREVVAMVSGRTRRDLDTDRMFQLAPSRLLEIIGEAAGRVTLVGRERYDGIPWADIVSTRDRIVHGYEIMNLDVIWEIATMEVALLIVMLERALPGHAS
jgi:uncharacterized protein with HEPN domain